MSLKIIEKNQQTKSQHHYVLMILWEIVCFNGNSESKIQWKQWKKIQLSHVYPINAYVSRKYNRFLSWVFV